MNILGAAARDMQQRAFAVSRGILSTCISRNGLLQATIPGSVVAVPRSHYSSGKKKNDFSIMPEPYGQRIRKVVPGVAVKAATYEETSMAEETETDSSAVEGDTFPDPPSSHENPSIFYDPLALKFINLLMKDGKKSQASKVFAQALAIVKKTQLARVAASGEGEKIVLDPMVIFHQAVENVKPSVATQSVKKGGKSYHVPCSITAHRRTFLACKWIIISVREKNRGIGTAKKLAVDFLDSYNHQGAAIKKKQDLHRLADANRAYSHFRW